MAGMVKTRAVVVEVGVELAGDVERWWAARRVWERSCCLRDREVGQAQRRLVAATGGLGVVRWQRACQRRRFRTIEDAKTKARALRARPAAEGALAELRKTVTEQDLAVTAAHRELAVASARILIYGRLGIALTGMSAAELMGLARSAVQADQ